MLQNWKKILMLAIPSLLSFATATVIGTVNLIMVGHLGALIIAIVGVSNIIMYNGFAIFSGIGHTVNYLVAQNYGANDMRTGIKRMYYALYLVTIFAIILFVVGWFFSGEILGWTGGSSELVGVGEQYLELRFFALSLGMISFVFHGFLRGIGDTKTSMVLSVISNVIILFLVYGLVFGHFGLPELGLEGSGYAILIGEFVGLVLAIYVYFFRLHPLYQTRTWVVPRLRDMKELITESTKLGVQEFSMSLSMFIFTVFVARLGTEALAANEVALNVMSFGFMPAFAFGATATILVGQEVGRGQPLKGRRAGTDTAIMGSIFLLVLGTLEFIFAENIAMLYNNTDPAVYHTAAQLIMISAFLQLFDGFLNFYAGGLRGIGDTTFLLRTSLVVAWCLFVPLSYVLIFVFDLGSIGAWIALYSYLMVFGLTLMYRFYRTDWQHVKIKGAVHAT
ncbi:MATE family efflux transporter [Paenibacillus selenitireducens]|uniref:Probable multidrug resistance protein NorM n=1 Tax=Paenibacillus selenitireducens TaxID=1324314 RepID=A0A1T2XA04_9BACL|nr:MATE family efflux transporter [Paenibacillus selenitireducens]OPA76670.1 MATE family efflux transporter [Paenibacillus selenitireducens]